MDGDFAERARALVGTCFRPQGRSVQTGLDCIGLVIQTFGICPESVRRDYRLRGDHRAELEQQLSRHFRRTPASSCRPGDVLLLDVAHDQQHLAVRTTLGFVHADARIGRVVETPGQPGWPIVCVYRMRRSKKA